MNTCSSSVNRCCFNLNPFYFIYFFNFYFLLYYLTKLIPRVCVRKFVFISTQPSLQVYESYYGKLVAFLILSGSGKSYLAKMLRDLEVENGGHAPRIHSMDDYFLTEVEKVCCWPFLSV